MAKDCTYTIDVIEPGNPSCEDILAEFDLTVSQFYKMNPSVGSDCSKLWSGKTIHSPIYVTKRNNTLQTIIIAFGRMILKNQPPQSASPLQNHRQVQRQCQQQRHQQHQVSLLVPRRQLQLKRVNLRIAIDGTLSKVRASIDTLVEAF